MNMDVNCEKCSTEYSLDETLVGPTGTSVRCTSCGHVFRVMAPAGSRRDSVEWQLRQGDGSTYPFERLGVLQQWIAQGKVSPDDFLSKGGQKWKRLGDIAEIKPFFTAAQAMANPSNKPVAAGYPRAEKRDPDESERNTTTRAAGLAPRPQIQFDPNNNPQDQETLWPDAQTEDLTPTTILQKPEQLLASARQDKFKDLPSEVGYAPTLPGKKNPPPDPAQAAGGARPGGELPPPGSQGMVGTWSEPGANDPDFSDIPVIEEGNEWHQGQGAGVDAKSPAWADSQAELNRYDEQEMSSLPPPRRRIGSWIALVLVVGLIGGGIYLIKFKPQVISGAFGGLLNLTDSDRHKDFFVRGRESFLLDSEVNYRQADREFHQALALNENHAPSLAGLAELYSVWAQYLRDAELDARADAAEATGQEAEAHLKEAERLHREFEEKLAEGLQKANQALVASPTVPAVHRAAADIKRLEGDLEEAKQQLKKAKGAAPDPETDYVAVLIALDSGSTAAPLLTQLDAVIKAEPLIRAMYRRARVLASTGELYQARAALAAVTKLNSDHTSAKALLDRIESGKTVLLGPSATAEQAATEPGSSAAADAGVPQTARRKSTATKPKPAVTSRKDEKWAAPAPTGGSPDSMLMRAVKLQRSGQTTQAISLYERVLIQSPSNIDALAGLAQCQLSRRSYGQAIAKFRRILNINPSYAPALFGLAQAFEATGQQEQAVKYYKQYLSRHPSGRKASAARSRLKNLEESLSAAQPAPAKEEPVAPPPTPSPVVIESPTPDADEAADAPEPPPAQPPVEKNEQPAAPSGDTVP